VLEKDAVKNGDIKRHQHYDDPGLHLKPSIQL
jgi:hypothetical protein